MDKEKLNTTKKKSKKSKKHKSSSKRNKYEKESASVISVDPSSMPSFIAPEPPSTHAYANQSFNYANLQQKAGKDYSNESDGYERQKPNTAKLYSTTYGADYYVVGDEKGSQKAKQSKYQNSQRNNPDLSASVVSNDYENLKDKPKNPRDMRNSSPEDPQDVYEPIDQPS
ncbi:hypothetical protein FSP39_005079 [Pinctada imbricata]|uniref:Uncharacterized protein n=1 Tax=Pinctada imbricata TaxID=66713 RepID=A0AA88Y7L7_PINIB|nr:hypothetical protein FSP39_005079 [Pinctada imbricata]